MAHDQDGRYLQELRFPSSWYTPSITETLVIPAVRDNDDGQLIVFLSDVQLIFGDARCFADNGKIVPFKKDNNLKELIPLRIEYRHGTILELLTEGDPALLNEQDDEETLSSKQKELHTLEKQRQILQEREQDINRLVAIQEHVQHVATTVFAGLGHPFRPLFVVLPIRHSGCYNYSIHDYYSSFRLFFLCVPDRQSTKGNRPRPNIHLARHEGYDIQNIEDFFKEYTPYLVSIFNILKNGIASPRLNVPRLSYLTLAEGINDEVQDVLNLSSNTILSLMNVTITHLQDKGYYKSTVGTHCKDVLNVVESTDLNSVLKHLRKDGHVPGNLRQTIPLESDKWVCADHYYEGYRGVTGEHQDDKNTDEADKDNTDQEVQSLDIRNRSGLAGTTLLDDLNDTKWTSRERAILFLSERAEHDETVLQGIIRALADSNQHVREAAVRALRVPSRVSQAAHEAVINIADDIDWNVREAAMQVLGDLPQLSRKDLSILVSAAGSDRLPVKYAAMDALIKRANSESVFLTLVETIRSNAPTEKVAATKVPETQTQSPEVVVDVLIDTLGDGSQDEREYVLCTLQSQSELSVSATQALPEKVLDEDSDVREAFDNQNSVSKSLIPTLIRGLNDKSIDVQTSAAQTLGGKCNLLQFVIQELFGSLSHERVSVRGLSAIVLAGQDALSKESIQALTAILSDKTLSVREGTVQALGSPSLQSQSAIENLVGLLEDDDPKVRGAAVYSLGRKKKMPEFAVQALIRTLDDGDLDVQEKAIQVLGVQAASHSKVVDALLQLLESQNDTIRNTTIAALSRDVQLSDGAIQKLVINLQGKCDYVGAASVKVLCNHTKWSESAVEALVKAVLGDDAVIRRRAVIALMSQDKLPEAVVGNLIAALKTNNRTVFPDVIRVLGGEVNSSEAVVEILIGFLCEINMHIRRSAEEGLLNLTQISESAIQLLKGIVRDKPPAFRVSALNILGNHVHTSDAVALIMLNAFKDANIQVKNAALQVLHRSGLPEPIVLQQLETLKNGDKPARDAATNILSGLPKMSENATQALIEYLKDDDKEIRKAAALSLKGQVRREDVVQALTVALSDPDSNVRHASVTALETLSNKAALPDATTLRLITLLKDNFKAVRDTAGGILGGLPNMSREDVQVLIECLKDDNTEVRMAAVLALKGQVKRSDDAIQAVTRALKDTDSRVRHGSVTVLGEVCHQAEQPNAVILELVKALKDDDSDVRDTANDIMTVFMGMFIQDAFQELLSQLEHQNWEVRAVAVRLISRQVKYLDEILDALTSALGDIDARVRVVAVRALKGLPYAVSLPDPTVLELVRALVDASSEVRCTTKTILSMLPTMSGYVIRTLIEQLRSNDGSREARMNIAQVLSELFKPKLATLQRGLFIPDNRVERFSSATIQDLIDILQDDEPVVSQGAEAVLKRRTTLPEFATAALVATLSDTRHHVSDGAHRVLHRQNLDVLNRVGAATLNEDEEVPDTDNDYKFP